MATRAIGQFDDRFSADAAHDELMRRGFAVEAVRIVERDDRSDGGELLLVVDTDPARYADACLVIGAHGGRVRSESADDVVEVVQSVGASPGAAGQPEPPAAHVNDDPGLVETPVQTRSGTSATLKPSP